MSVPCRYHCRGCDRHFYSLEAFDSHIQRETEDGPRIACFVPDADDETSDRFVGFQGECEISGPTTLEGIVWELSERRGSVRAKTEKAAA